VVFHLPYRQLAVTQQEAIRLPQPLVVAGQEKHQQLVH